MGDFASRASTAFWRGRDRSVADTLPSAVYRRPGRPVRPSERGRRRRWARRWCMATVIRLP